MNKFQIIICKMYHVVYLYHKNYKTFLMDRRDYSGSRLGVLFAIKFAFTYFLIRKYNIMEMESKSEIELFSILYLIIVFILIDRIVSFSKKNYEKVSINLSQKKVKLIYYLWHFILIGGFVLTISKF